MSMGGKDIRIAVAVYTDLRLLNHATPSTEKICHFHRIADPTMPPRFDSCASKDERSLIFVPILEAEASMAASLSLVVCSLACICSYRCT